jgi:hypothetical protein
MIEQEIHDKIEACKQILDGMKKEVNDINNPLRASIVKKYAEQIEREMRTIKRLAMQLRAPK